MPGRVTVPSKKREIKERLLRTDDAANGVNYFVGYLAAGLYPVERVN